MDGKGDSPISELICWEALDPDDPALNRARHLYESTQDDDELRPDTDDEDEV